MKTIRLGSTSLEVSRIAYGCMEMGGSWEQATSRDIRLKAKFTLQ